MSQNNSKNKKKIFRLFIQKNTKWLVALPIVLITTTVLIVTIFSIAPNNFTEEQTVTIKQGTYLSQAADILKDKGIIKSSFLFKIYVVLTTGHRQVLAGDYLFDEPQSALRVAHRLANGIQGLPKIKITIFEGMTNKNIGELVKKNIPKFDLKSFLAIAKPYEGYLFPDTYYLYENSKPEDVLSMFRDTFTRKIKAQLPAIQKFGKPMEDVIKMASIVEKEANNETDRKIIAGILWRRISIGMPLQVDPPFYYILGKTSSQLTLADLATDSPYNLYKHTGLPPSPIDNPGLSAIIDTITPTETKYLFFLSDANGKMHYSETHEGHLANKEKYLQ
jgi:UPF0755 protein